MRKKIIAAALSAAIFGLGLGSATLRAQETQVSKFSLRLYGGASYMSGGDLNTGLEGYSNYWIDLADAIGYSVSGTFSPARLGLDFGGDIIFQLTPTVGIGFGAGYLQASKTSTMSFAVSPDTLTQTANPSYHAVPLRLGLFLTLPASPSVNIILNAGVGYYMAKATSTWSLLDAAGDGESLASDVSANGFGVHGGIAFEFKLSGRVGLLLEIHGRYAKIGPFTGTGVNAYSGTSETTSGTLYYFELPGMVSGRTYPVVYVFDTPPTLNAVREAKIDFSGGAFRLGLVIHL